MMLNGNEKDTVAVTGLGLMTGLGCDVRSTWQGILDVKSPISQFTLFDPKGLSCTFGAELPGNAEEIFAAHMKTRNRGQMTRCTKIALTTADMAIEDAGIDFMKTDSKRIGVVIGTAGTGFSPSDGTEQRILKNMISSPAAWISLKWKLLGPSFVVSTACSSGAYALHIAYSMIRSGMCDCVVTGAADSSINYHDVEGFCSVMALSDEKNDFSSASRPFDKKRNGFVIGEGAGMMILESEKHARARNARIYASMPEPGLCSESYNIRVQP